MAEEKMKKDLSYDDKVIKKIAGIATDGVAGVLTVTGGLIGNITDRFRGSDDMTKGIGADVGKKQVALDLNVVVEYGRNVPEIFEQVAGKVAGAVTDITGLELVELNMHVEDILGTEDFENYRQKRDSSDYTVVKNTNLMNDYATASVNPDVMNP